MVKVVVPENIKKSFREKWYDPRESSGYTVAYKPDPYVRICLLDLKLFKGSHSRVETDDTNPEKVKLLVKLYYEIPKDPELAVLATHSHPIEGLSPHLDLPWAKKLIPFGIEDILVIGPRTIASYHTSPGGIITPNNVEFSPEDAMPIGAGRKIDDIKKILGIL